MDNSNLKLGVEPAPVKQAPNKQVEVQNGESSEGQQAASFLMTDYMAPLAEKDFKPLCPPSSSSSSKPVVAGKSKLKRKTTQGGIERQLVKRYAKERQLVKKSKSLSSESYAQSLMTVQTNGPSN